MKRLLLFSIVGLTIFASCKEKDETISDAMINDGETIHMLYGESQQLDLNLYPKYVESLVEWRSSAADIVSVDPVGTITALKVGEATITATTTNKDFAPSILVVVTAIGTEKIEVSPLEIEVGKSGKLKITVSPNDASYKNALVYKSTDATVAKVGEDGEVQAISVGECQIEVASPDGVKAVCNVEVKPIKVTNINLKISAEKGISVKKGESYTVEVDVVPSNATNKNITWTTSDASVATVANGVVTGVAAGTAIITVKSEGDGKFSKSFTVTVTE
jgi:uncharacterized protein YjdB